jgi:hypothetical protein
MGRAGTWSPSTTAQGSGTWLWRAWQTRPWTARGTQSRKSRRLQRGRRSGGEEQVMWLSRSQRRADTQPLVTAATVLTRLAARAAVVPGAATVACSRAALASRAPVAKGDRGAARRGSGKAVVTTNSRYAFPRRGMTIAVADWTLSSAAAKPSPDQQRPHLTGWVALALTWRSRGGGHTRSRHRAWRTGWGTATRHPRTCRTLHSDSKC